MSPASSRSRVLIAGGGIAALEGLLALCDLSDGDVEVTLLCPEREFMYRPLLVLEPFSPETADRRSLPELVEERNGTYVQDSLRAIDPQRRVARTDGGVEIEFDFALVAIGARMRPAFESAHTLWIEPVPTPIETLLDRAAQSGGLDLIVPPGVTWTLPLYEFALMAERRTRERGDRVPVRIVTPEQSPLVIFGPAASSEVSEMLAARGIAVSSGGWVTEGADGSLDLTPGHEGLTGYPVALPVLEGIPVAGLPSDQGGFIPIDEHARVRGCDNVFAAGDGTDFPVKQGGIATQQADAAAEQIAADSGADIEPHPREMVLRGKLLTGSESVNMRTPLAGGGGEGVVASDYLWWPPHKVSGRYLAPWLAGSTVQEDPSPPARTIEVEVSAPPEWHHEVMPRGRPGDDG